MGVIVFEWPERIDSGDNARRHWRQRAKRMRELRTNTKLAWLAAGQPCPPDNATDIVFVFTRIAPRPLDKHDGLPSSFKAIVDLENVETGWINFSSGGAPACARLGWLGSGLCRWAAREFFPRGI